VQHKGRYTYKHKTSTDKLKPDGKISHSVAAPLSLFIMPIWLGRNKQSQPGKPWETNSKLFVSKFDLVENSEMMLCLCVGQFKAQRKTGSTKKN